MVTIFIKKRSVRRPVTVNLEGWGGYDTAEQQLAKTQAAWPARKFRFYETTTVYTQGPLTITFDLTGKAVEGYSYNACLFAFAPPSEDYPQGRLIWNDTSYSITTNSKHRWPCIKIAQGVVTGTVERYCPYLEAMETQSIHGQWAQRMIVDNMPWSCSPGSLLEETRTWRNAERAGEYAAQANAEKRAQRAAKRRDNFIASGKHLRLVEVA